MPEDRSMPPGSPPAEPLEPQAQRSEVGLATITLRQIRVSRSEVQDKTPNADANPMNRLVPYLDLYCRLSDDDLARLAGVDTVVVSNLRRQVVQVDRALVRFTDLLPRLSDPELVRLTGATPKTIRFWRLCQPRQTIAGSDAPGWSVAQAADLLGRVSSSAEGGRRTGSTGNYVAMRDEPPLESGAPLERHPSGELTRQSGGHPTGEHSRVGLRHPSGESPRAGSSAYRMPVEEREGGSSAYRMPAGEREGGSSAYRMPVEERDGGRRVFEPPASRTSAVPPPPATATRTAPPPLAVDLSRPRTGRTQEVSPVTSPKAAPPSPAAPPPEVVQKQQAVSEQMLFSGAPFPGYDSEASGRMGEDDGIFIGLELPDPRTLPQRQD